MRLSLSVGRPGPHDFAVRADGARLAPPSRPSHPRLTCRDDRDTPSFIEAGWRNKTTRFRKTEAEYFSREGWTVESAWHRLANIRFFAHAIFSPPAADTWANDTVCRWLSARRANQCCKRKTPVAACRRAPPMARLRLIAGVRHGLGSEKARAEVDPIAQQHERKQQAGAAEDDDGAERFDIDLETGGARKHSGKGGQCSLQQNRESSVSAR